MTSGIAPTPQRVKRADARRNMSAILDAAVVCLQRDPAVSVADIAAEAGVGRITVYGHFPTRTDLVQAVFERTVERADAVLAEVDTSGDPTDGLALLVSASWRMVEEFRMILLAAQRELDAEQIRAAHDRVLDRIRDLLERGRSEGAFRSELPTEWLTSVVLSLIHGSANEVDAGRVDADRVGGYLVETLLAVLAPSAANDSVGLC